CGACSIPLPCSSEIFSSRVISFRTSAARSSGERLVFIQGWLAFCAITELTAAIKISSRASTPGVQDWRGFRFLLYMLSCIGSPIHVLCDLWKEAIDHGPGGQDAEPWLSQERDQPGTSPEMRQLLYPIHRVFPLVAARTIYSRINVCNRRLLTFEGE